MYLVHFIFFIVYFNNFRGSKNRGSMDPGHDRGGSMDLVHDRGSMDPVHERGFMDLMHIFMDPFHGPGVHVLYFPFIATCP